MNIRKYITLNLIALAALLDYFLLCFKYKDIFLLEFRDSILLSIFYAICATNQFIWENFYIKIAIFLLFILFLIELIIRKIYPNKIKDIIIKNKIFNFLHATLFYSGLIYLGYLVIGYTLFIIGLFLLLYIVSYPT